MELKIIGRNRRVTLKKNQPLTRLVVARLWSEGNSQIAHTESVWKGAFHDFSKGSEYRNTTRNTTTPDTHHGVATVRGPIRKIPGWIPTRRIVRHHRVGVGVSTSDPGFPRFEQCVSTRNQNDRFGTEAGFLCRVRVQCERPLKHKSSQRTYVIVRFAPWCR
jgi:hypothetical protein